MAPQPYPAVVLDGRVQFERAGRQDVLRETDGTATGMKWLADKKDCLTVSPGEGYCRD